MQTFLPEPNFMRSAMVLDDRRLGKQRVEVKQILNALLGETSGWRNHPATRMWQGHERSLACYGLSCCAAWRARGFRDSLTGWFLDVLGQDPVPPAAPPWFGDKAFHLSHQSNLVRKMPEHYRRFYPDVPSNLDYVWPVR